MTSAWVSINHKKEKVDENQSVKLHAVRLLVTVFEIVLMKTTPVGPAFSWLGLDANVIIVALGYMTQICNELPNNCLSETSNCFYLTSCLR